MKNAIKNFFRNLFLKTIMKQSNNFLPLTNREMAMVKFFVKYNLTISLIIIAWALPIYTMATFTKTYRISPIENYIAPIIPVLAATTTPIVKKQASAGVIRQITMYTSRVAETDASPCISADGTDICKVDYNVCASNSHKFGTKLYVEKLGECIVRDRMNKKFKNRIDWYAKMDLDRALKFGIQQLAVSEIK